MQGYEPSREELHYDGLLRAAKDGRVPPLVKSAIEAMPADTFAKFGPDNQAHSDLRGGAPRANSHPRAQILPRLSAISGAGRAGLAAPACRPR